jgi:ectoine hydroxylase-related dioxygenase (phytanoyl-CoA dioxygenase family)
MNTSNIAADYDRDGFVVIPSALSPDECRALKEEGLRVLREHSNAKRSVHVGIAAVSEVFYKFASDPRLIEPLKQIMPDGVMFMSDKFVFKSGTHRFGSPWHCDIAYWRNTRPKLSIWIPLDDVTAQNGALKVIPGGHKREWQHGASEGAETNGEFNNVISSLPEDVPEQIVCEMPAGSLLIFSDMLPHASMPNTTGADRYAIIGTYHAPAPDEPFDVQFSARHVIVPR